MGRTTNRQPVTFAIPKSPAYKFLNVTEFKGLNISDNPFTVGADSASDCLNVYVDESNALTTRPRIEKIFSMTGIKKVLHTYSLEKDTVFQVLNNDNAIKLYHYDGVYLEPIDSIRFTLKEDKYCVFEKDDVYYVAGNGIYANYTKPNFVLNKIKDVYVPIRYTGDVLTDKLVEYEDRNILTKKYRVAYSWDTKSNPSKIYENNGVLIDNEYHRTYESNNINYKQFNPVVDMFENTNGDVFKIGDASIGRSRENIQLRYVTSTIKNNHAEHIFESDPGIFSERDLYGLITTGPLSGWIVEVINKNRIKVRLPLYHKSVVGNFIAGEYYEFSTYNNGSVLTEIKVSNSKIIENQKMLFGGDVLGISPDGNVVVFSNKNRTGVAVVNIATKEIRYLFYDTAMEFTDTYSYHTNAKCVVSNDMYSVLIINTKTTEPGNGYENAETGEEFIDFYYDWQLTAYSYDSETEGYTKNVLYTNEKHPGLYSAFVELKYDAINDKALIYYPGGNGELLYINSLASVPTEAVKRWNRLLGKKVTVSFSDDLLTMFNIADNNLYVGVVTDAPYVSEIACDLDGLDVKQQALSSDNLFTFSTPKAVYGYDATKNTYYKLYDLSVIPNDDYYNNNVTTQHLLSKNTALYRTQVKWNGGEHASPSADRFSSVKYFVDSVEFSKTDALIVEYSSGHDGSNQTDDNITTGYFGDIGKHTDIIWLDAYDNILGIGVRVYNDDGQGGDELLILPEKIETITRTEVTTPEGHYLYTYDKERGRFFLSPLTADIVGNKFDIRVVFAQDEVQMGNEIDFNSFMRFQNNFWFYGKNNVIQWTDSNDPTYIPANNYKILGDSKDVITDMLLVSYDTALAFKKDTIYVINPITADGYSTYTFVEAKSQNGSGAPNSAIISPLKELPMFVNNTGIYGLQQLQNVQSTDRLAVLYSERMNPKFLTEQDITKMKTVRHLYWVLFMIPREKTTGIYVFDDRSNEWFYWELPIVAVSIWEQEDVVYLCDIKGGIYAFKTTDIINKRNGDSEYYDDGNKPITWYWKSQILPLGTINYSKKLLETTFILSDTDSLDNYGINYTFKAYRKLASETNPTTISDSLNYVQSVTKRTMVHRFKFLQIEISNTQGEKRINDKFRLIGLGLKYTLLEGLR